jgi:hypothetical protein
MAIRKAHSRPRAASSTDTDSSSWPYAVLQQKLTVQKDGSVRIPASLIRLIAERGEEVSVALFTDGHAELEGEAGRTPSPSDPAGARTHQSDEEFSAALRSAITRK